ncbi:MAG: hypothetical protein GF364_18960 [Candidatus Lokiarchaeota archaeon]|nr:hypothetical protein [Candidatus Lokiarchaeota archaeon]
MSAEKLLDDNSVPDLFLKIKICETLADAFNKTKDKQEMKFYMDKARQIRKILQVRGLY